MDSWHDELDEDQDTNEYSEQYGGKDAIIFLIDVSSPDMHIKTGDNEDTAFQMTLKAVHATLRRKVPFEINLVCM